MICIYVAIGQKASSIKNVIRKLEEQRRDGLHHRGCRHRFRVRRDAVYVSPYSGCTMGEYFRDRGQDALIIYDDLTKQAVGLSPSVAAAAPPAGRRERIPGDVFYLHSAPA